MYGLHFRDEYDEPISRELDALIAKLKGFMLREHNEDGTHNFGLPGQNGNTGESVRNLIVGADSPTFQFLIEQLLADDDFVSQVTSLAKATLSLTELQLESLNSTPVEIVAGGSGIIVPIFFAVTLVVATGYSSSPDFQLIHAGETQTLASRPINWSITGTKYGTIAGSGANITTYDPTSLAVNVRLSANPGTPGTGVATATAYVLYFKV